MGVAAGLRDVESVTGPSRRGSGRFVPPFIPDPAIWHMTGCLPIGRLRTTLILRLRLSRLHHDMKRKIVCTTRRYRLTGVSAGRNAVLICQHATLIEVRRFLFDLRSRFERFQIESEIALPDALIPATDDLQSQWHSQFCQ